MTCRSVAEPGNTVAGDSRTDSRTPTKNALAEATSKLFSVGVFLPLRVPNICIILVHSDDWLRQICSSGGASIAKVATIGTFFSILVEVA